MIQFYIPWEGILTFNSLSNMLFLAVEQKYLHGWKAEMSRFYIYKLLTSVTLLNHAESVCVAVSRNRYGVAKTVDTHKILINAIQCYVCLQEKFFNCNKTIYSLWNMWFTISKSFWRFFTHVAIDAIGPFRWLSWSHFPRHFSMFFNGVFAYLMVFLL
jgi:hypothetical protein